MSAGRIEIGMWGWRDEPWTVGFYPGDLPEDWRLAYFANEFRRVYVPAAYLLDADAQALEAWCTEVKAPFRFVLELPRAWSWSRAQERWAPLLAFTAVVVTGEGKGAAVADTPGLTRREAIWTPQTDHRAAGCGLGLIRVDAPVATRTLKGWVADFADRSAMAETSTLVFTGGPHALDVARQARMIAELMGL